MGRRRSTPAACIVQLEVAAALVSAPLLPAAVCSSEHNGPSDAMQCNLP